MAVEVWVHHSGHLRGMREALREFVIPTGPGAPDVTLAANELATNALLYAGSPCQVSGTYPTEHVLRLAVTDVSAEPLQLEATPAAVEATSGRGLAIVAAVASRWGVEPARWGKTVWFEVDLTVPVHAGAPVTAVAALATRPS